MKKYMLTISPVGDNAEISCGFRTGLLENYLPLRETNESPRNAKFCCLFWYAGHCEVIQTYSSKKQECKKGKEETGTVDIT